MGCFSSKEALENQEAPFTDLRKQPEQQPQQHLPQQQLAHQQSQHRQCEQREERRGGLLRSLSKDKKKHGADAAEVAGVGRRGVSFAGDVNDEPSTGRRVSRSMPPRSNSFVGADLHAIMDEHGMLNPMVSRQLSVMSHYSVRSESGSVMITPEQAKAPFRLLRLIGRGGFGNVYLGEWDGERVAVKVIAGNNSPDLLPEELEWEGRKERMAQMEAVLMSAITHPNIVNTYKVTSHSGDDVDADLLLEERRLLANAGGDPESGIPSFEWHILMEYCDKGSLSKMLASFKLHHPVDSQTVNWNAWTSLEVLKETADALSFLHEHRIIHGDLKAANVLLASSDKDKRGWESKVSDFGLSRVIAADCPVIKTHTFGTVTHMPPELLSKGRLLPSSDVYAFGVLMWEVYTGEKVFKQLSDSEVILAVVTKRARPIFPSDCPSRYRFLAEKCWAEMHELRPSLKHIISELDNLQKKLCPDGPDSEPIPCRVFPTRQRMLEQYRQQIAVQQAQAAAQQVAHSPMTNGGGNSNMTRPPPRPGVVPLNQQGGPRIQSQSIDKHHKRIDSKDMSPHHTHSASEFHKSMGATAQGNGNLYKPQRSNKSFGASLTKSPLGAMASAGTRTYERAKSLHGHHPDLNTKSRPDDYPHPGEARGKAPSSPQISAQGQSPENGAPMDGPSKTIPANGNGQTRSLNSGAPTPSAANMPLHPSLMDDPASNTATPIVGQPAKRPSVLKPSASKRQHVPSPRQSGNRTSGGVRFEV